MRICINCRTLWNMREASACPRFPYTLLSADTTCRTIFSIELIADKLRDGFKSSLRAIISKTAAAYPGFSHQRSESGSRCESENYRYSRVFCACAATPKRVSTAAISLLLRAFTSSPTAMSSSAKFTMKRRWEISRRSRFGRFWHSDAYRAFRRKYVEGANPSAGSASGNSPNRPGAWTAAIDASAGMSPQLLRGWHPYDGSGSIWSKKSALLALAATNGQRRVVISGTLPHGREGQANEVSITCNRLPLGVIRNEGLELSGFEKHSCCRMPRRTSTLNLPHAKPSGPG